MRMPFQISLLILAATGFSLLATSCAPSERTSTPQSSGKPSSTSAGVAIPGFESLGSPLARRKADVVVRFGSPVSEEKLLDGRYTVLAYPVSGWNEKLLILFAGEELLGFSRESSRAVLDSTMQHHARISDGSIVVYQSWDNGQTTYFRAPREQLDKAPKWKSSSGTTPPLSDTQALSAASDWLTRTHPNPTANPIIQGIHEVNSLPGTAFYVVGAPDFEAKTLIKLVVLMDGTVLTGEGDAKP